MGTDTRCFHGDDFDDGFASTRNNKRFALGGGFDETGKMGLGFVHVDGTHDTTH